MTPTRRSFLGTAALAGVLPALRPGLAKQPADPLPAWNDCPSKRAILDFVAKTTTEGGPDFVKPYDRVAVFDNDGTLWPEQPWPFEGVFAADRVRAMAAAEHPEWKTTQPFKDIIDGNVKGLIDQGLPAVIKLVAVTHTGMTTAQFDKTVRDWIATARHPRFDRPYTDLAYKPMLEVLAFLRANGYKTFIVSGGGAEFMRVWADKVYGIPPEQVVGTMFKMEYQLKGDRPDLCILPEVMLVDDKGGKPVGIEQVMGRRPVMCFGNSDGDLQMLQWTTIGRKPSFGLIVHHTDAVREWAYDKETHSSGKLVEALKQAPERGWTVVDMKADWKQVFTFKE
ncbi:MAG: haloacid dehalogenase-like hydrolase [Gemmataceae bacterium]|nr:haloacid dehalogenase-like hydrolase [Gemmataceae bacterium]